MTTDKPVTLEVLQAKLQAVFASWLKTAEREDNSSLYNYSINVSFNTHDETPSLSSVITGCKIELEYCMLEKAVTPEVGFNRGSPGLSIEMQP